MVAARRERMEGMKQSENNKRNKHRSHKINLPHSSLWNVNWLPLSRMREREEKDGEGDLNQGCFSLF